MIVNGKWKAIPFGNVGQIMNWRSDWFAEVGIKDFPDTWDELLEAGIKLKKADHPFGFELGHGFGDNHGWLYPLLWSYGAREVEPDGKTIVIDSDETARAVDFCRKFFLATTLEDCLGWTDVSNNKAWMSEQISCTNNAESILWFAKKQFPDIAKVTEQSLNPQGPKGRFHILAPWSHAIYSFSQNQQASKDFLVWLMDPKQVERWYASADSYYAPYLHAYDDAPLWHVEPRNLPYRDSLETSHLPGWPAPIGRSQSESVAKYVVVDMFAKACAGKSTKEVIADANAQLKQIRRRLSNVRHRYTLSKLHARADAHSNEICSKDWTRDREHAPRVGVARAVKVRCLVETAARRADSAACRPERDVTRRRAKLGPYASSACVAVIAEDHRSNTAISPEIDRWTLSLPY